MHVVANGLINGLSPVTVGGTGLGAKYFPTAPGASIGVPGVNPMNIFVPGNGAANGQLLEVVAAGNFEVGAGGACPSFTAEIVANTGTPASPTYTSIATTGAITAQNLDAIFYPWFMRVWLQGDTGSGIVQGYYTTMVDGTLGNSGTPHALTSNLTGINFSASTPYSLVCRVSFGVSESGNSANLYEFVMGQQ